MTEYTAETTNASDQISATATDTDATVEILSDDATIADDGTATWGEGENVVQIAVSKGGFTNLYTVTASLLRRNEVRDEVSARCGVRSFSCSPRDGFTLNGKITPLRGVCRHQDRLYRGNALTKEEHWDDARIIKELGANAIRLAHYQHSQDFYDACDELGFVVWAEIPFITRMSDDPAAHDNCVSMMKELIIQNYNHPCICFWGLSNEVLLAGKLTVGDVVYEVPVIIDLAAGFYTGQVVTEDLHPIPLLTQ